MKQAVAAGDTSSLVELAKDPDLKGAARTALFKIDAAAVRRALFNRKDLTESEAAEFFAGETRASAFPQSFSKAPPWKLELLTERALALRNQGLAVSILQSRNALPSQVERLALMLKELGHAAPQFWVGSWPRFSKLLPELSAEAAVWITAGRSNDIIFSLALKDRTLSEFNWIVNELVRTLDSRRLADVVSVVLGPVDVTKAFVTNEADKARALVAALTEGTTTAETLDDEKILVGLDTFRFLTVSDGSELIPHEPILGRLGVSNVIEIARVLADSRIALSREQLVEIACNPNHSWRTASELVGRFRDEPDVLAHVLGAVGSVHPQVLDELRASRAPRITVKRALDILGAERLAAALNHDGLGFGRLGKHRAFLPARPFLLQLASRGWKPATEQVAFGLDVEHARTPQVAPAIRQLLDRQLGKGPDGAEMFFKMAPSWDGTIGDLIEVVRGIQA